MGHKRKVHKLEGLDNKMPLSLKFEVKSKVKESSNRPVQSGETKPLLVKLEENESSFMGRKPSTTSKKRTADCIKSSNECVKKPRISYSSTSDNNIEAYVKSEIDEEVEEDHVPLSQRMKISTSLANKSSSFGKCTTKPEYISWKKNKQSMKIMKNSKYFKSSKVLPGFGEGQKWATLVHNGVIFPPPYKPHGVKMLCKGKPVDLTPKQEEVDILPFYLCHTQAHMLAHFELV